LIKKILDLIKSKSSLGSKSDTKLLNSPKKLRITGIRDTRKIHHSEHPLID